MIDIINPTFTYMWQQWVNLILGLWIILSGYLNFTPSGMAANLTISGLIIAGMALWGALEHRTVHARREQQYRT